MKKFLLLVLLANAVNSYSQWTSNWAPYYRHCNSIIAYSNQKAIIAGGNEFNDSIRSVFTSNDRGASWNVEMDALRPWLKSIAKLSNTSFVAVGGTGAIIKSTDNGDTWVEQTAPGNAANRNFNAVFFVDSSIGYIAGGWRSLDSIQTILKTTDGGASWSIQRDNLGRWLTSIYFTDANNGVAVGERGTILKTTDGGANWNPVTLSGNAANRNFSKVHFINASVGFIVGGNRSNDSIQTILKTTDGGNNWSVLRDNLGPMFNGIGFASTTKGYIVGNRGVVYETSNAGDTWTDMNFDLALTDTMDLTDVDFYNADFGFIVGRFGKLLKFDNPLPTVPTTSTLSATSVTSTTATLQGQANALGSYAKVTFEYGTTQQLGTTVDAVPDTVFGNANVNVSKTLTSLLPNTFYYYRTKAENNGGYNEGIIKSFYTAECIVPNCDFEIWDTTYFDVPDKWSISGTTRKVTSYDGSSAVEISEGVNNNGGAVVIGDVENEALVDGLPLTSGRPDSLIFYAKYDVVPNDTAFGVCIFKRNAQIYHLVFVPMAGSSGGNFVRIATPISYPDGNMPDSVLVGITSTNAFNDSVKYDGSIVTVDNVSFTGITDTIPNGGFEQWKQVFIDAPASWQTTEDDYDNSMVDRVQKTTDRVSGNYAIKIRGEADVDRVTEMRIRNTQQDLSPAFPVGGRHQTFNFYTKFTPDRNTDTLFASASFFKGDSFIGNAFWAIDTLIDEYTPIEVPIYFHNNNNDIPDSAQVTFRIGSSFIQGNPVAYIDNISFDGFKTPPTAINEVQPSLASLLVKVYPNPANDRLNLEYYNATEQLAAFVITDLAGKQVLIHKQEVGKGLATVSIAISPLAKGNYFLTVNTGQVTVKRKFIVTE